ncbi:MAG: Aldehyde ferredoxin oxidoreductase (Aor-3) [Archaeoglobus fulgidus]|uniref:Aldehyde ferredoxin oxidoreductase (Aor-3) n=1 Tax=Archaeoglobus fulgidus TaxID=2234 RepID=A0A101DEZ6_ARCFL|nr:aldehyde ferredoxin oxidoreductase family protein [Archaeoglobus fulgidus]KUJ94315.1 MAG: Aldehyde ferredoxin oxidoreductase (Aor-3) [Archaeoglobus fulgidus]
MYGYCGKILRVDLSEKTVSTLIPEEKDLREFIGGAGYAVKLHYDMRSFEVDPLSPQNPLVIVTGPLTATKAPSTSRLEFCARSPFTGIWGESNSGGRLAAYLKYAGWDGIIVEGASDKPVLLKVDLTGAEILDAEHLWGKGCYETQEQIEKDLGEKRVATAVIGPAGENLVKYACIQVDNSRHAGRTGVGAVMGSKKLKGIAVVYDPSERQRVEVADEEGFNRVVDEVLQRIKDDFTCNMFTQLGTSGYMETAEGFGDLPIKYYTQGTWDGATKISGAAMAASVLRGNDGCLGCVVRCGRVVEHKGKQIHGPEYETLAAFGALQLNDDLESLIEINYLVNDLGMDSISAGVSVAFAMYLTEKGVGDFNIKWGDAEAVKQMVKDIACRRGKGEELAEGVRFIGLKYGKEAWSAHVKGLEIPMHDARAFSSLAAAYATHPRGACHLPHQMYLYEMGKTISEYGIKSDDRFSNEGKGILAAKVQNFSELFNAITMCAFMPVKPRHIAEMLRAVTGYNYTVENIYTAGERMFTLKRVYNVKCGVKAEHDTLPEIVLQPLEGGSAGNVPDVKKQVSELYEFRKWPEGVPSREKLEELGLEWVE